MRKILIVSLFLLAVFATKAQDKIITHQGDTIFCQIISVSNTHIRYEQETDGQYVLGKSIAFDKVKEYFRTSNSNIKTDYGNNEPEKQWLISTSAGGSYLPWVLNNMDVRDSKNLDKGLHVNSSIHYLITNFIGIGFQHSFHTSGYEGSFSVIVDEMYPIYAIGYNRNRQYTNFFGASTIFQQFVDPGHRFQLSQSVSFGLITYREESQVHAEVPSYSGYSSDASNMLVNGMTYGAMGGLSAEYYVIPNLSVGVAGNFLYSRLKKVSGEIRGTNNSTSFNSQELSNPLNLSRIDYSLILRIRL